MERLEEILELEHELSEIRYKINKLIIQKQSCKDLLIDEKINALQQESNHLNNQIRLLKENTTTSKVPVKAEIPHKVVVSQESVHPAPVQQSVPVMPIQPNVKKEKKIKPKKDLEKIIGKVLLPIAASILLMIGVIFFAIVVYPLLNDNIRVVAIYAISAIFTVFGLYKVKKEPSNKLYLSVAGCGVILFYISLLLTNVYFKLINETWLIILLLIWSIITCILSKQKSKMFQIIGELGIFISMIFGVINDSPLIVITLFFALTSLIYMFTHLDKIYYKNLIHFIPSILSLCVLLLKHITIYFNEFRFIGANSLLPIETEKYFIHSTIIIVLYILINIIVPYFKSKSDIPVLQGFTNLIYLSLLITFTLLVKDDLYLLKALLLIIPGIITIIINTKKNDLISNTILTNISSLIVTYVAVTLFTGYQKEIFYLLFIAFLVLMYIKSSLPEFKYSYLLIGFICFAISFKTIYLTINTTIFVLLIIFTYYLLSRKYNAFDHILLHLLSLLSILILGNNIYEQYNFSLEKAGIDFIVIDEKLDKLKEVLNVLKFTFISTLNLIILKTKLGNNFETNKKNKTLNIFANIINAILLITTLIILQDTQFILLKILIICVACANYLANSKNLLDKNNKWYTAFYIGLKLTVLLIASLNSLNAPSFGASIGCFILAILCILVGFKYKYKYLRNYGLLLSIVSIIKLIMIDIQYASTIENAISFIISGLLCFAIGFIYNKIDKKIENK